MIEMIIKKCCGIFANSKFLVKRDKKSLNKIEYNENFDTIYKGSKKESDIILRIKERFKLLIMKRCVGR